MNILLGIINYSFCVLFSLLSISFHLDIALLAFPLAAAFTAVSAYFYFVKVRKSNKSTLVKYIRCIIRFMQYQPFVLLTAFVLQRAGKFGKPFALDLIMVILWVAELITSLIIQFKLNKKFKKEIKDDAANKPKGKKRILYEILDWGDAILQAVFTIMIINIFLFQLYEIPSESMVPEFLIRDRVIVFKTFSGPKFPLSKVGLPNITKYNRGDVVVFRNPHYSDDRKSEVKTFFSNFLYMCTLTLVNTNRDQNGEVKADPLVKRVVGIPGEQLMLQNGTLYSRTKASPEFKPVEKDRLYAAWDLNPLPAETKQKIQVIPLSVQNVADRDSLENTLKNLQIDDLRNECVRLSAQIKNAATPTDILQNPEGILFSKSELTPLMMFRNNDLYSYRILKTIGGWQWMEKFLTSWANDLSQQKIDSMDLYTLSNLKLNIYTKITFAKMVLKNADLISGKKVDLSQDVEAQKLLNTAQNIFNYISCLDQRNMSLFPPNDKDGNPQYIPEDCYFMIGDNRYNSLDMRHAYEFWEKDLCAFDPMSVQYSTNLAPEYVHSSKILGKASFRFWPLSRMGNPNK